MSDHRLFLKLFVGNLLIVCLVVAAAGLISYRSLNAMFLHETESYQDHMAVMTRECVERLWPMPDADVDRLCKRLPEDLTEQVASGARPPPQHGLPIRVTVIAADGRVLGDSLANPAQMANHKTDDRPEVLAALAGRPGRDQRQSETLHADYRYVALPIRRDAQTVAAVRVALPAVAVVHHQAVIRDVMLGGAVATFAAFALIGLLVNWTWYRPLRRMAEAASQIASGELAHRAPISWSGELGQLGVALNEMRDSISDKIATITAQREDLETVLASLREAVIALDAEGNIVLANRAARKFFAPEGGDITGRHVQRVVRATGIADAYTECLTRGQPVARQMDLETPGHVRHLDVRVAPMGAAGRKGLSHVVVARDVTDLVRTSTMKAEFVANASHELRTPLASLRAAADSLADVDPSDRADLAQVAGVIDRQIRRLEDLTHDLLILHSVEGGKRPLSLEPVPVGPLAQWLRAEFAAAARRKNVTLDVEAPAPDDAFTTDRRLVELILQNLVDNAIKFTPAGGRVTCNIRRDGKALGLRVSDTGGGIRREDQPHVFDRFFQADASRSRDDATRGTGLGLAIVKHACERLGGTVSLESEPARGTTVTVLVPDRGGR